MSAEQPVVPDIPSTHPGEIPQLMAWSPQQMPSPEELVKIDNMDEPVFESLVAHLLQKLGYDGQYATPRLGNFGADTAITKAEVRTAVRTKHSAYSVGLDAVQQVVAALPQYRCTQGLVITNNLFTTQAVHLARVNQVQLWGRSQLQQLLALVRSGSTPAVGGLAGVILPADIALGSCAHCNMPVPNDIRDLRLDNPERFGGYMYCAAHQQAAQLPAPSDTTSASSGR